MELEDTLPCSQEPVFSPCPELMNPVFTLSYLRSVLILTSHLHLGLPSGLFLSGFPVKN
jgi:hypothetical protein